MTVQIKGVWQMDGENALKRLREIITQAMEQGASDVHLASGQKVYRRVDGRLLPTEEEADDAWLAALCGELFTDAQMERFGQTGEAETGYTLTECCRMRVNLYRQQGGYALALRLLPLAPPAPKELGIPDAAARLAREKSGLILVTGAAGSGVTTTLAAFVGALAANETRTILTIEKPIEYMYEQCNSLVLQREIGKDSVSYESALLAAEKQDADVILMSELCDAASVSLAISAAESGCLVFAACREPGIDAALERVIRTGGESEKTAQRLAGVLKGALAQKLLPAEGGGRVAAFELLLAGPASRNMIAQGRISQLAGLAQSESRDGIELLDDAIYNLYMRSRISSETAVLYANDAQDMQRKVQLF